jgi:hypothetical protein
MTQTLNAESNYKAVLADITPNNAYYSSQWWLVNRKPMIGAYPEKPTMEREVCR